MTRCRPTARSIILEIVGTPFRVHGGRLTYWTRYGVAHHVDLEWLKPWQREAMIAAAILDGDVEELPGGGLVRRPPTTTPAPAPRLRPRPGPRRT